MFCVYGTVCVFICGEKKIKVFDNRETVLAVFRLNGSSCDVCVDDDDVQSENRQSCIWRIIPELNLSIKIKNI